MVARRDRNRSASAPDHDRSDALPLFDLDRSGRPPSGPHDKGGTDSHRPGVSPGVRSTFNQDRSGPTGPGPRAEGRHAETLPPPGRLSTDRSASHDDGLQARFLAFHEANPHVARRLADMAVEQRRAGVSKGSIAQLYEVLRWQTSIETAGEPWLLNNDYRAPYARLLMRAFPELDGFFEVRASAVDGEGT